MKPSLASPAAGGNSKIPPSPPQASQSGLPQQQQPQRLRSVRSSSNGGVMATSSVSALAGASSGLADRDVGVQIRTSPTGKNTSLISPSNLNSREFEEQRSRSTELPPPLVIAPKNVNLNTNVETQVLSAKLQQLSTFSNYSSNSLETTLGQDRAMIPPLKPFNLKPLQSLSNPSSSVKGDVVEVENQPFLWLASSETLESQEQNLGVKRLALAKSTNEALNAKKVPVISSREELVLQDDVLPIPLPLDALELGSAQMRVLFDQEISYSRVFKAFEGALQHSGISWTSDRFRGHMSANRKSLRSPNADEVFTIHIWQLSNARCAAELNVLSELGADSEWLEFFESLRALVTLPNSLWFV